MKKRVKCNEHRYLESSRLEQHDLVLLTELLKSWDALCKLHNLFDSRGEALGEGFPNLLTGTLWT